MISVAVLQVLKTSLFTSLLIGLLLMLLPLLQKWYRAKWRYIAWIVIAVRLLIPVNLSLPQAPINIELPEQVGAVVYPASANVPPQADIWQNDGIDIGDNIKPEAAPVSPAVPLLPLSPMQTAGFIWLAGVAVFLLFQVCAYQVFLRKLRISQTENVPASFKETVWGIGVEMGICKLPEAVVTTAIDAPVLIGVLHPRVLLPHTKYSGEELAFILRHELVHYHRRDMWYKLVLILANALHWFNPLIYLMTVQATRDIELACDDEVTRELDQNARAKYGDTILSALPRKRRLEPVFSTHFGSTKENIKGRLRNMFDMAVKRKGIAALCAVVVCALTLTSFVTFGYAAVRPGSVFAANDSSPANFLIQRLGKHSFNSGDTIKTNLSWSGKETVMLLYTNRDYNDDEILVLLQGLPGIPKPNYGNVDRNKTQGGVLNFISSPTSPLSQEQKVAKTGVYNVYIIRYGFDVISPLAGDVNRVDVGGDIYGISRSQTETANDISNEIPTLTGNNNVTVKSIKAGEVKCIGKIELGPDSAYTATVSVESGSGAMIALNSSPNITRHAGTAWNLHYGAGSNLYFSSEQRKTAYVYVGSMPDGTKLTNVTVRLVQSSAPISSGGNPYFQIKSNGKSILQSGSFEAKAGQTLTITATSNIKGGSVDFFLFSPAGNGLNEVTSFTFGGSNAAKTIELSAGRWAYNCTGFFESGDIVITGTIMGGVQGKIAAADKAAYEVMRYSRSWEMVEYMLPYMTRDGIDAVVKLNNELNSSSKKTSSDYYGLTTPSKSESDQRSYTLMEKSGNWTYSSALFPYMTNEGIDRVVALYNQKTGKNVKAKDYYN